MKPLTIHWPTASSRKILAISAATLLAASGALVLPAHATTSDSPTLTLETKVMGFIADDAAHAAVVNPNEEFSVRYVITNSSSSVLEGIGLCDDTLDLIAPDAKLTASGEVVEFGDILNPGESVIFMAQAPGIEPGATHSSTAQASFRKADGVTLDIDDSCPLVPAGTPGYSAPDSGFAVAGKLSLTTTINDQSGPSEPGVEIPAGQSLTMTYTVTNDGPVVMENIRVEDVAWEDGRDPIALEYHAIKGPDGAANGAVTLAPGETATFTLAMEGTVEAGMTYRSRSNVVGTPQQNAEEWTGVPGEEPREELALAEYRSGDVNNYAFTPEVVPQAPETTKASAQPTQSAKETESGSLPNTGALVGGLGVVAVALVGGGTLLVRRRQQ